MCPLFRHCQSPPGQGQPRGQCSGVSLVSVSFCQSLNMHLSLPSPPAPDQYQRIRWFRTCFNSLLKTLFPHTAFTEIGLEAKQKVSRSKSSTLLPGWIPRSRGDRWTGVGVAVRPRMTWRLAPGGGQGAGTLPVLSGNRRPRVLSTKGNERLRAEAHEGVSFHSQRAASHISLSASDKTLERLSLCWASRFGVFERTVKTANEPMPTRRVYTQG